MGFLSPWFLAGLIGIGVPVYLHLLRQHKSTPRKFSSLMFFDRTTQSSIKHRRLRHLALMFLRLALLALVVLAFASPYVMRTATSLGAGDRLLIVVVDNSFSMREGNRLERARQEALSVVADMREGEQGQAATLGAQVEFLTLPTSDPGELRAAIESIEPSDSRSSYGELARSLRAMGETSRVPLEIHLCSDMQQSSMPSGFADLVLPPSARLVVHPVAGDLTPNFAVESVIAQASLFNPEEATVQATIAGFGTGAARHTVSLAANGNLIEEKSVTVPGNGRATVEFLGLDVPYGFNRCEVRIGPADGLAGDDRFLFAVERADPRQILYLTRRTRARDSLYFQSALESSANAAYRMQVMDESQARSIDPGRYAIVVLSDPRSLDGELERNLKQYVRGGGAVLIAAGPSTARASRIPVMDLPVLDSVYETRSGSRFRTATYADASHPVTGIPDMWDAVKFYRAVRVDAADGRVLARLADETPLLVERAAGEGRMLLFTSTFDNLSNDFPLSPAFVAFVERATRYLGRLEERTAGRNVDDFFDLRAAGGQAQGVEIIDPNGERPFSIGESAETASVRLSQSGFYEVRRGNNRNEMVAVNADRREANLAVVPAETLALWQNTGEEREAGAAEAEVARRPVNLWWYVLLLALAAAVAESLFGRRYLGMDRSAG